MTSIQWEIRGPAINNCNCNFGCPCQFNAYPTHGQCCAIMAMHIDKGNFGDTDLSGLNFIILYHWPKAVHEGNGSMQCMVEEGANEAQREAIVKISRGEEMAEGASVFQVFASTMTKIHEPEFVPMECEIDIESRSFTVRVPELVDSKGDAIRNATTGEAQNVSVNMPGGFEYTYADYGSGTTKSNAAVALDFEQSHAHWCTYHFNQDGIVK